MAPLLSACTTQRVQVGLTPRWQAIIWTSQVPILPLRLISIYLSIEPTRVRHGLVSEPARGRVTHVLKTIGGWVKASVLHALMLVGTGV